VVGNNPYPDDLFCPECGTNVDVAGYREVDGHFRTGTVIYECETCESLVQDGEFLNKTEAREIFG
jgi:ribosomal protein L37AE/L43A